MDSKFLLLVSAIFMVSLVHKASTRSYPLPPEVKTNLTEICRRRLPEKFKSCNKKVGSVADLASAVKVSLFELGDESRDVMNFLAKQDRSNKAIKGCLDDFNATLVEFEVAGEYWKTGEASYDVHVANDMVNECVAWLRDEKLRIPQLNLMISRWFNVFTAAYNVVDIAEDSIHLMSINVRS